MPRVICPVCLRRSWGGVENVPQTPKFNVGNLARDSLSFGDFKPDQYRTSFATFNIATGTASDGEYRIGAKRASAPAPTAQELIDATAAITRTISNTEINIYLPFHIEGTHFDTGTTKTYDTITATQLSPNTAYKIYVTALDGSGTVEEVLTITTDSPPATAPTTVYGIPSSAYTYTSRANEATVFRVISPNDVHWLANGVEETNVILSCSTTAFCIPNPPTAGYTSYIDTTDATAVQYTLEVENTTAANYSAQDSANKDNLLTAHFSRQPTP